MVKTETRNASLQDLGDLLKQQQARKIDMVAPASSIRSEEGLIRVKNAVVDMNEDGVTTTDGLFRPTDVFDEGVSDKLKIPLPYVRRLRRERPDLYDANVNGWLHGRRPKMTRRSNPAWPAEGEPQWVEETVREGIPGDGRQFLLRAFGSDDGTGIARALLSDRYAIVDHLDALMAALDGVREAGVEVRVDACDLSERRMAVRVVAPEVKAYAEELMKGYRSPFRRDGEENPTVFAGFVISNSETGGGAYSIAPRFVFEVCDNGMTVTKDAIRAVHLGGRLEDGLIKWSEETATRTVELVKSKTKDAVRTFLDVEYMKAMIARMEEKAGKPVEDVEDVKVLAKKLQFSEAQIEKTFEMFVRGGQMTVGGVMNAVTAAARVQETGDQQFDMEAAALRVLEIA